MPIKVSIVEDDKRVRESLGILVDGANNCCCVGTYPNAEVALKSIPSRWPDVVLMDINLPNKSGIDCVAELKQKRQDVQFIMLTSYADEEQILQALKRGASGYLLKKTPPAKIVEAIEEVHAGGAPMTPSIARKLVEHFQFIVPAAVQALTAREREILDLLVKGLRNKEIGEQLGISLETVRTHLRNIYDKLHVSSRAEAVGKYLSH